MAVSEKDLPVELPYLEKYEPSGTGESPLAKVPEWVNVDCPNCGEKARRETDTMPNWAGSNWYFLRYLDTQNDSLIADPKLMKYWMPIDLYQGGFEHTTLHLLYSRFVYKFLYDIGVVPTPEPYAKRRSHGIVLGPDGRKMSKSFGNVINPDDISRKFGADTLRVYEMFMGPFDQTIAWSEESVEGCFRFLKRVWHLSKIKVSNEKTSQDLFTSLNKTIKKVDEDFENMKFNTAVAAMMEFVNSWQADVRGLHKEDLKVFLLLLAPFAPHMTEELYQFFRTQNSPVPRGGKLKTQSLRSIHLESWPVYDSNFLVETEVTIAVQINGKLRDTIKVTSDKKQDKEFAKQLARASAKVSKYLAGKKVQKVIYVEGKVINFVI
jgi:leucyl-tRNA synthetase